MKKNQKVKKETTTDLVEHMFKRLGIQAMYVEKSGAVGILRIKK